MKRVTGIGGIFFQSESPEPLYQWYEKHLGIKREPHGQGATFEWRELQAPDGSEPGAQGRDGLVDLSANHQVFWRQQSQLHGELSCR